jgi:exopolyphosphatase / guanosine-5'-triphosphate,3'-diphosphate pyrophosphatase
MIYSIIDIGSNTMRMNIYKYENDEIKLLFGRKNPAGLAGYVERGVMSDKGIKKAIGVLRAFKSTIDNFDIDASFAFATASLRNINNSKEALALIKERTGIEIDLISGEEEAKLDFAGATKIIDIPEGVLVDIGGGSTEIVTFKEGKIMEAISIPIGSLNLYKKYTNQILPDKKERKKMKSEIKKELKKVDIYLNKPNKIMCGVGGSIRATRKLNDAIIDIEKSTEIEAKNVKKILKTLSEDCKESVDILLQVVPDRIHTIIPGMIILNTIIKYFESESIMISDYGVREGYLYTKIMSEGFYNETFTGALTRG